MLDQEPNLEYLGHPINAFNLIKHSAIGWKYFNENVIQPLNKTLTSVGEYKNNFSMVKTLFEPC